MKRKIMALCLVAILAITAIGGATLAYFTDTTDEVENTFTVGNVNIELTEPEWDPNEDHNLLPGVTFEKDPTITVDKKSDDCWIFMEVQMNKFNSWLRLVGVKEGFVKPVDDCQKCEGECKWHIDEAAFDAFFSEGKYQAAFDEWFAEVDHASWKIMNLDAVMKSIKDSWNDPSIKVINPIFAYKTIQKAGDSKTLFTSVTMPEDITSEDLAISRFNTNAAEWKLTFNAYAIRAAELTTVDAAYAALFA